MKVEGVAHAVPSLVPPKPTAETPLTPIVNWQTGQVYYPERAPPIVPEGYKVTKATVTPEGKVELTMQKTVEEVVSEPAQQPVPKQLSDPVSQRLFKDVEETQKMQADPAGYVLKKTVEIGAAATGLGAPAVAIKGGVIGLGIAQGVVGVTEQRVLSATEVKEAVLGGAAFSGVSTIVFGATGIAAIQGVKGVAARTIASSGLGAGAGYVFSGGRPEGAVYGAALGAGFSLGGEALSYAYPRYVKPALGKAYEKMFPEHGAIKSALGEQTTPKLTLKERVLGQKAPTDVYEKFLYKRAITQPQTIKPLDIPKGAVSAREVGVSYKTPSGFAKQTLVVKAATQKVGMKPWVLSTTTPQVAAPTAVALTRTLTAPKQTAAQKVATQKQVTTQIQKELTVSTQQQVQNPFLQYQGKPYYRTAKRQREETELVYLTYPRQAFGIPSIERLREATLQRQVPLSSVAQVPSQTQLEREVQRETQLETQVQREAQLERQTQQQIQEQVQDLTQVTQQKQKHMPQLPSLPSLDMPGGFRRYGFVYGGYGRYKRMYPVMTGKQMLKEVLGK